MAEKEETPMYNQEIPGDLFTPEAEKLAVKLAAFDIMKQLCEEGRITKDELYYIARKHDIYVDNK